MDILADIATQIAIAGFIACQFLYFGAYLVDFYLITRPVDWVDPCEAEAILPAHLPMIVLLYPVLRELESTMRTTFLALQKMHYPRNRYVVVAIPNADDSFTCASLKRLQQEFSFLQILPIPPTTHPSWDVVWNAWDRNPKAYWWHGGKRAFDTDLPPKKTRQLIYAFYNLARDMKCDWLLNYIDADSCAAAGPFPGRRRRHPPLRRAAGHERRRQPATQHGGDLGTPSTMAWDGMKYPHLSANGRQPYWVLGKGMFFRASDLLALGGFHPWLTIEDPEVGMRFWANGKRLGIIEGSLIEEVPSTLMGGITQRKRWVAASSRASARR